MCKFCHSFIRGVHICITLLYSFTTRPEIRFTLSAVTHTSVCVFFRCLTTCVTSCTSLPTTRRPRSSPSSMSCSVTVSNGAASLHCLPSPARSRCSACRRRCHCSSTKLSTGPSGTSMDTSCRGLYRMETGSVCILLAVVYCCTLKILVLSLEISFR